MKKMLMIIMALVGAGCYPTEKTAIFPLQHYDQRLSAWIDPHAADFDKPLLSNQEWQRRQAYWFDHYYGKRSPWNNQPQTEEINASIKDILNHFDNRHKQGDDIGIGMNLQPYPPEWFAQIRESIDYSAKRESLGITINNCQSRELPTDDPYFFNPKKPGEGYPFDNLQAAMIWAGTPVYVLRHTRDGAWSYVRAPNLDAWVKSTCVASVNKAFITTWVRHAKRQQVAITQTQVGIKDRENKHYRFSGFVGMVFPGVEKKRYFDILIPVSDAKQKAQIRHASLAKPNGVSFPLSPTPRHLTGVLQALIHRPYGWGGMNAYNDCASELKNLFSPFGIWLPTHSSVQVDPTRNIIKTLDLSTKSSKERLKTLMAQGHKFMTIIYVGGHVMLYLGNYADPKDPQKTMRALSYQNVWGLKPKNPTPSTDRRAVIGGSVLLPLLPNYPEDPGVASQINKKIFKMAFLDASNIN